MAFLFASVSQLCSRDSKEVGTQARRPPTPAWQFLLPVGTRPLKSISSNSPTWRNLRGDLLPACPPCQIRERPGTLKDLLRVSSSVSVFHRKEVKGGQVTQRACESQTLGQHPLLASATPQQGTLLFVVLAG